MIRSKRLTRQSFVYEISSTATHEIFESNNFIASYFLSRYFLKDNETKFGKYEVVVESKKNKDNYWNTVCNTKDQIKDFINEYTDIKIVNSRI